MRDRLPDLLHGRLDAAMRAEVERHVAACADCAAELDVLRTMRRSLTLPDVVNPAEVAAAVQHRLAAERVVRRPRRARRDWRVAAAAAILVTGGLTVVAVRRAPQRPELGTPLVHARPRPAAPPAATPGLMFGGGIGDLGNDAIEQLLQDVDSLTGVPDADPAPVLHGFGERVP
jgi:hypothetical protein